MAFLPLVFSKSWENSEDFPTYEPNESQVRADLQLLHEETRIWLNDLVAQLNDPSAAEALPFRPENGLTAETVQDAVMEVYAAIRDAAAGLLVDGSVTREKLAEELLARMYGGRVYVSLDTPGAAHNPQTDFPVGQLWLRPACTVENRMGGDWTVSGGTLKTEEETVVFTADGSLAYLSASQKLNNVGSPGQTVVVTMQVLQSHEHLSSLTLYLNGLGHDLVTGTVFQTELDDSGSLELVVQGQWPYAEAGAAIRLGGMAAVNVDAVEAALTSCAGHSDWAGLIRSLLPFSVVRLPRRVFLQTQPGTWVQVDHEVLPVDRGGTGVDVLHPGQLVCGGETALQQLPAGGENSFLQCIGGLPVWKEGETMVQELGLLRLETGSYDGVATTSGRTVTLSVTPKLLVLCSMDGGEEPVILINGASSSGSYSYHNSETLKDYRYYASVKLSGNKLVFSHDSSSQLKDAPDAHFNHAGNRYRWTAIF